MLGTKSLRNARDSALQTPVLAAEFAVAAIPRHPRGSRRPDVVEAQFLTDVDSTLAKRTVEIYTDNIRTATCMSPGTNPRYS